MGKISSSSILNAPVFYYITNTVKVIFYNDLVIMSYIKKNGRVKYAAARDFAHLRFYLLHNLLLIGTGVSRLTTLRLTI